MNLELKQEKLPTSPFENSLTSSSIPYVIEQLKQKRVGIEKERDERLKGNSDNNAILCNSLSKKTDTINEDIKTLNNLKYNGDIVPLLMKNGEIELDGIGVASRPLRNILVHLYNWKKETPEEKKALSGIHSIETENNTIKEKCQEILSHIPSNNNGSTDQFLNEVHRLWNEIPLDIEGKIKTETPRMVVNNIQAAIEILATSNSSSLENPSKATIVPMITSRLKDIQNKILQSSIKNNKKPEILVLPKAIAAGETKSKVYTKNIATA
ncbi:hypothetical protein HON22_03045 [Candidatus Peregrinibacteria bacterium]|jgi:hypothetical protein|nr:hypothetical protein [Candidatus Peregrinibacteria bacterium]